MKLLTLIFSILISVIALKVSAVGENQKGCFVQLMTTAKGAVRANGIYVTGNKKYPLGNVLDNLNLASDYQMAQLHGRNVLSVGEGMSSLVPYLRSKNVYATGLDLWYDREDIIPNSTYGLNMKSYINEWGDYLQAGSALDLPYAPDSFDMVVSHLLINNLEFDKDMIKAVDEAIRVTAVGGEIRFLGVREKQVEWWKLVLKTRYGKNIDFDLVPKFTPDNTSREGVRIDFLLSIKKHASEYSPLQW